MKQRSQDQELNDRASSAPSEVMTLREVAAYLNCHASTVYRLAQRGELPGFHLGTDWRFLRSKIDEWITARELRPSETVVETRPHVGIRGKRARKQKGTVTRL